MTRSIGMSSQEANRAILSASGFPVPFSMRDNVEAETPVSSATSRRLKPSDSRRRLTALPNAEVFTLCFLVMCIQFSIVRVLAARLCFMPATRGPWYDPAAMRCLLTLVLIVGCIMPASVQAQVWSAKVDDTVRFYQPTDVGAVILGTKKSVYAVDSMTGDILWRRKDSSLDENDVAPIPGTDLVLMSFEKGSRTRLEAIDALSGDRIWQSEKLRGAVMHIAVEPEKNLLAVVMAKDAKGPLREGFKRKPV